MGLSGDTVLNVLAMSRISSSAVPCDDIALLKDSSHPNLPSCSSILRVSNIDIGNVGTHEMSEHL